VIGTEGPSFTMGSRPAAARAEGADGSAESLASPGPGQYEVEVQGTTGPAFTMAGKAPTTGG
jgi:hypothetical protein